MWVQKQDDAQAKILELTRNIQKVEEIGYDSKEDLQRDIVVCNASIASSASSRFMKHTNPVLRPRARSSAVRGHIIFTEYRSPSFSANQLSRVKK